MVGITFVWWGDPRFYLLALPAYDREPQREYHCLHSSPAGCCLRLSITRPRSEPSWFVSRVVAGGPLIPWPFGHLVPSLRVLRAQLPISPFPFGLLPLPPWRPNHVLVLLLRVAFAFSPWRSRSQPWPCLLRWRSRSSSRRCLSGGCGCPGVDPASGRLRRLVEWLQIIISF